MKNCKSIWFILIEYTYHIKNYIKQVVKKIIPLRIRQQLKVVIPNHFGNHQIEEMFLNNWRSARQYSELHFASNNSQKGINLIGYIRAMTGIGEAARSTVCALNQSQIPFCIIEFNHDIPIQQIDNTLHYSIENKFQYNTNLIHVNPIQLPYVWEKFGEKNLSRQYNIGVWYWELQEFPDEWVSRFGVMDEIWVASEFIRESLIHKTSIPIITIPPCIQVEYDPLITRRDFNLPEGLFLFFCAYDTLSVHDRKNPLASIDAFIYAFSNSNLPVGLVVKINNADKNLHAVKQIRNKLERFSNCYVIEEIFPRKINSSLLKLVDVFVSLHRSEGFGLIPAEAMYLGKPVIMTNWSGNTDFMATDNSCGVNYKLVPVGKGSFPYTPNQLWAEPDIEHAAFYMEKLFSDSEYYSKIAHNASNFIQLKFSPRAIGDRIGSRLEYLKLL